MIDVKYDKQQLAKLYRKLNRLTLLVHGRGMKDNLEELGKNIKGEVRKYPAPVSTSNRTGNLKNKWMYEVWDSKELHVKNLAEYAGYVQGKQQRSYHKRHGWSNAYDVAQKKTAEMVDKVKREVLKLWRR